MERLSGRAPMRLYLFKLALFNLATLMIAAATSTPVAFAQTPDTQAPTAPANLSGVPYSSKRIDLSWSAATDNVAVTAYSLERCQGAGCTTFTVIATPVTTNHSDTGLTPATPYSYRVRARDAANNLSNYSATASAATQYSGPITYSYTYDNLGRISRATGTDGSIIDYSYDANGNVTTIQRQ